MAVDHHKGLHPHHLHIEEAEEERAGLALSGVAEVKEVEEGNREAGEPGTLGIILQKHIIICLIFFFFAFHLSKSGSKPILPPLVYFQC